MLSLPAYKCFRNLLMFAYHLQGLVPTLQEVKARVPESETKLL